MTAPVPTPGCRALFAHLSEYLDGELPQVECDKLERHCRTCGRCRYVIGSLRRTIALCRESGAQVRPPAAVRARALARVAQLLADAPPAPAARRRAATSPARAEAASTGKRPIRRARKKR